MTDTTTQPNLTLSSRAQPAGLVEIAVRLCLNQLPEPCLDSFVFLRVKEQQDNIMVEPETDDQREYVVDLEEGSQHLMRYRTIAPLVSTGAVQLI